MQPRSVIGCRSALLWALGGLACAPTVTATPYPASEPASGEAEPSEAATTQAPSGVVRFFDREIDLRPFLAGFPYRDFDAQLEDGVLFYLDARETYTLRRVEFDEGAGSWDLAAGEAIGDTDWSKRSLWGVKWLPERRELWLHADASNDEKMNLWVIDMAGESREPVQRTKADYVYGYGVSEDKKTIAYLPRTGAAAPYRTCVNLLDLESGEDREILCDDPALRFTWGRLLFSPDGKELYFSAQVEGDRTRVQLVRVDLEAKRPKAEPITDVKVRRSAPALLAGWDAEGRHLHYVANDDGFKNLYVYDRKKKRVRQLTRWREDIAGAVRLDGGIFATHGTPAGSTLELVDPQSGEALARGAMPGKVGVLDGHGARVLWSHQAPDVVFELLETRVESRAAGASFTNTRRVGLSPELSEALVQCKAEAVRIPTFDKDPVTGKARELHAFLLAPKKPITAEEGAPAPLAMVRAFYGGDNAYTRFDHIMCAAGITLLSPAVRGSSGFGKDFSALNDGDLGGDEIVDLFYAARWLGDRLQLPAARIGVYGRSHGGYATMRAMTFDPATNDRNEDFAFGFGLADAGFSDIVAFHDATNIPDWVHLESGDPADPKQREAMLARSPLHGVERLRAPIFLLHGAADWRVPVEGSRAFVEAARAADKAVTYHEVPGQGHHIEGLERIAEAFQARFDFLMGTSSADAAATAETEGM